MNLYITLPLLFIATSLLGQASHPITADHTLAGMIEHVRPSVVRISDSVGSGSGFFINSNGLFVTAKHVISSNSNVPCLAANSSLANDIKIYVPIIRMRFEGFQVGTGSSSFPATVVACDDKHDIAVLKADPNPFLAPADDSVPLLRSRDLNIGNPLSKPSVVRFNPKQLRDGESIFTSGYPLTNVTLITTSGYLASSRPMDLDELTGKFFDMYLADIRSNPGNSGGPVFLLKDGSLIGMIEGAQLTNVLEWNETQGTHSPASIDGSPLQADSGIEIVIPASHIQELLRSKGISFTTAP